MHRRTSTKSLRVVAAGVTATAALTAFGSAGQATPAAPVHSSRSTSWAGVDPAAYPWKDATGPRQPDGHGYAKRSCTSFAAWAIRTDGRHHRRSPDFLGEARNWTGTETSAVPHVGDIAQWDPGAHGVDSEGNLAYVAAVGADGTVTLLHEYGCRDDDDESRPGSVSICITSASDPSRYLRF